MIKWKRARDSVPFFELIWSVPRSASPQDVKPSGKAGREATVGN